MDIPNFDGKLSSYRFFQNSNAMTHQLEKLAVGVATISAEEYT